MNASIASAAQASHALSALDALTGAVRDLLGADVVLAFGWSDDRTARVRAAAPALPAGGAPVAWPATLTLARPPIAARGGVHVELDVPRRLVSNALRLALPVPARAALVVTAGAPDGIADDASPGGLLAIWHTARLDATDAASLGSRVAGLRPALARALAEDGAELAHDRLAARLAAVMTTSAQAIVFVDAAAGTMVNAAAARLLGLGPGAADTAHVAERMAALRARAVNADELEADARRLVTDPDARLEHWSWTFDAPERLHLRVASVPVARGQSPASTGRLWTFDDVTREVEGQRAARASEARFRAAMDASPDACFLLESVGGADGGVDDFVFIKANAGAGALLGMPAEGLVGKRMCETFPTVRGSELFARYAAVATTRVIYEGEYRTRDPRTAAAWLSLQVVPVVGTDAAGSGIAITARDVTAAKRAEAEARLVHDVTRVVGTASDAREALRAALAAMCTSTGFVYGEAWVAETVGHDDATRTGPTMVQGPVWHAPDDERLRAFATASAAYTFRPSQGLPGQVVAAGAPVWLPDITDPHAEFQRAALARRTGIRRSFAIPVMADRSLVAVLAFYSREAGECGRAERDLLEAVGAQVGPVVRQKLAEAALREREAELRALFAAMRDVVLVFDADGTYLRVMPTMPARALQPVQGVVGQRVHDVLPTDVADQILATVRRVIATGTAQHLDYTMDAPGGPRWIAATGSPLGRDAVLWVARDVTVQKSAEAAVRQSESRYRGVLENLSSFAVQLDRAGRITFVNDALLAATGWTRDEAHGADYFARFIPDEHGLGAAFARTVGLGRADGVPAHYEHEILTRDGRRRLVAWDTAVLRDNAGQVEGVSSVGRDVTDERHLAAERERLVRALEDLAEQDDLTGLLNRRGFVRMATQERKSAARTGRLDGVCYVDLDRFKPINDTYGHAAGDAALRAVARVLRDTMRGADFCARLGGDEFAVYALGITAAGGTQVLADRLRGALAAHNVAATAAGRPYELAFSVGVAEFTGGEQLDEVLARADGALYAAKRSRVTLARS